MCQQQNFQQPYRWSQISTHSKPARTMRNTVAELLWDKSRASDNEASGTVFDKWCLGAWPLTENQSGCPPNLGCCKPRILRFVLQRMEKVDSLPGICNIYMLKCWCVPVYANGQDVKVLEHLCHWWQRRRRGAMQGELSIQSKTYPSVMAERFCPERDGQWSSQTVRLAPFVRLFRTFVSRLPQNGLDFAGVHFEI